MKSYNKRLLSLVLVVAMALSMLPMVAFAAGDQTTLYVKPNSNWNIDGARFAAYFFETSKPETWVDCTDADGDGVYEVVVPDGYTNVIFCRMNPKFAANNWNNKWNQTSDLKVPTDNLVCYIVAENTWDKGKGQWVEYTPEGGAGETEPTQPNAYTYYVAGEAGLCGNAWSECDDNNGLSDADADGIFTKTYTAVAAGTYQFKVTDGTWTNCWGGNGPDGNYQFTLTAQADVTINFNSADKTITVVSDGLSEEPTEPSEPSEPTEPTEPFVPGVREYCLVGYINGADYGCNDDYENVGQYIFVDGTLTTSFTAESYLFVKTTDNAHWLMSEAYCQDSTCTFVEGASEKLYVPANVTLTFTLVENEDGTVTVSYVTSEASGDEPIKPEPTPDTVFYVAGSFNGWLNPDANYEMAKNEDGTYTKSIDVTAGEVQLKVTNGTWDDGHNWGDNGNNMVVNAATDGTITVTFDPATGKVSVTGDCLGEKEALVINTVHAVGAEGLTGCSWDPVANEMTYTDGVYVITFENVDADTYEFKFNANGAWAINWASGVVMESGNVYDAWFNAMGNSSVVVEEDGSNVTLMLDLTTMDPYTGEGGKCAVYVEAPVASGVTVSGAVVTGAESDTTVELISGEEVVATATVSGKEGTYSFENVAAGTYTLKVSKLNHVTREYTVTVGTDALTQDVKIHLLGDIDGNGRVNTGDVAKLNAHLKGTNVITDEYWLLCANVNGGKLNTGDTATLYSHTKGTKLLY